MEKQLQQEDFLLALLADDLEGIVGVLWEGKVGEVR